MTLNRKQFHEENRLSWNEATKANNSHKGDPSQFFREGGDTLFPEEIEVLGEIAGLSILHLQCNSGQDSLNLAKSGAILTGIDRSDEAIAFARKLSQESNIPATFYRTDVLNWLDRTAGKNERFDTVFSSYRAVCWLCDLSLWAQVIASILKPGGGLAIVDFHRVAMIFDEDGNHQFPYFREGNPLTWEEGVSHYVATSSGGLTPWGYDRGVENFKNPYRCHEFQWGIGEIVSALLEAKLTILTFKEYPYSNGCKLFNRMQELPGRRMIPPENVPNIPLMYAIAAQKPYNS